MTYSLGATGHAADALFGVDNVKIGDAAGLAGTQQGAMSQNTPVMCKRPDGSQAWFTIDAERSLPGAIVLKAV